MNCKSILAIALAGALLDAGCGPSAVTELVLVVDYSGSTQGVRSQQQAVLTSALESADPGSDFTLFRMGADTEEIMSGSLDSTPIEAVVSKLKACTQKSDGHRGTNFAKMAEAIAHRLTASHAKGVDVVIATDGGDDLAGDRAMAERYRKAAESICSDGRVRQIEFVGVLPENRASIRRLWSNAGGRLVLLDASQTAEH